ncbi:SID1 transmembrane family member 2 [Anabarilius grahami]|uniref:SID1 transmembrane family member 2 n=1 Tax=Anabarilius grahami TaxID=495550 RepID=A0A3N0Z8B7_ANAGA|nr:SID1 transmembrane family member 2 [Anabarilius grahami]
MVDFDQQGSLSQIHEFFKYVFPDGVDTVIVKVNSQKNFPCSVMSIQDIQDFPSNSFYVVVVVKTEDEVCGGPLRFYPLLPAEVYVMGMLFCLGIFLSFYLLTFLVACVENKRMNRKREGLLNPDASPAETGKAPVSPYEYGSFADNGSTLSSEAVTDSLASTDGNYGYMDRSLESVARSRQESLSSVEEDDYDTLADIDSDKNIVRTKVVNVTGNQDICYYNFLCAHPLGALSSFNNILSNLGYVMLGLLFLLIVLQRDILHNRALERNENAALHFGLYYAMGTALMMEGLLSACYHVCPNYTNFQFDTSFMYMIAGLCMLKLYQKRHPDINASAYSAYACLAAVIFFSVLGVVFGKGNTAFWIVFSVIHILATMLLSTQLYYMGRWRLNSGILRRILAAYGLIKRPNDFASYLLAIAICNLLLYFAFYIIMKGLSTWQKTPAESREHNRECILLSFFDDHDIWHFLSSIAMFGSFLVLLTMDDDLDTVQRDKIYVF